MLELELEDAVQQAVGRLSENDLLEAEYESGQMPGCPHSGASAVSGFSRYSNAVNALPASEQSKLRSIAAQIVRSFRRGCRPVRLVKLTGHADRDYQRGAAFEKQMSMSRAITVKRALQAFINNGVISSRIRWQISGAGASRLVVANPANEVQRARNRRVEITLSPGVPTDYPVLVHHPRVGYVWTIKGGGERESRELRAEAEISLLPQPTAVLDSKAEPFRWICSLELAFHPNIPPGGPFVPGLILARGTGTLISPRHVLTAGHCLLTRGPESQNIFGQTVAPTSRALSVTVIPGRDGSKTPALEPFGRITAISRFRTSKTWESSNATDRRFDYGLITLENPVPGDFWAQSGSINFIRSLNDVSLKDKIGHTSGYPALFCPPPDPQFTVPCTNATRGTVQFQLSGKINDAFTGTLESELKIAGGHSGSPVWVQIGSERILAGIASATTKNSPGVAVRIRNEVLNELRQWMKQDGVTPSF
jgi:V8-like Glu-specific endopeptidase/outer membrane protein OmpA-like peptidoglycan-associated protein